MLKIKLLNSGGYKSLENLKFPVVVNGFRDPNNPSLVFVEKSEMIKAGADMILKGMSFIVFERGEYENLYT